MLIPFDLWNVSKDLNMQTITQHRIKNFRQYLSYMKKMQGFQEKVSAIEEGIALNLTEDDTYTGFSTTAGELVDFAVHRSSEGTINWRETLICPKTQLSNRLRRSYDVFVEEACPYLNDDIYITEQVTPFFKYLAEKYPNLTGSEYLAEKCSFGDKVDGIRNETMSDLTFDDASFDHVLSFECLEHIPNFIEPLQETYRVLRKGGKFVFTVPFLHNVYPNVIRAIVDETGNIQHILPPEYHGDPLDNEGILCFTHFGWEILDILREDIGFSSAYAVLSWSAIYGNLGQVSIVFVAVK